MQRLALVVAAGLIGGACNRSDDGEVVTAEDACGSEVPVRLAGPPEGWTRGAAGLHGAVHRSGEHVVYQWRSGSGQPEYHAVDRCGGPVQDLALPVSGFTNLFSAMTADGPRLYGWNQGARELFLVDREEEPGLDLPRGLGGYEAGSVSRTGEVNGRMVFSVGSESAQSLVRAAGLGARTYAVYHHAGVPLGALQRLGDGIIEVLGGREPLAPWLVLFDSGELREIDLATGEDVLVQDEVRYVQIAPDGRAIVWQELGDGLEEAVYLRHLGGGGDVPIAINNFVAASWGQSPDVLWAGTWIWTPDGRFLGLPGADGRLVAVVRADDGAPVAAPAHAAFRRGDAGGFHLMLPGPERVDVLWDPASDAQLELVRGEEGRVARVVQDTAAAVDYTLTTVPERDPGATQSLWRLDRATGRRVELVPSYLAGWSQALPDGRILTTIEVGSYAFDLLLVDPETGGRTPLARSVSGFSYVVDEARGLYWLDKRGDEPGLWFSPFPPR